MEGDIIRSGQRNADSCVQKGCKWPKSTDGKVYVPYVISAQYSPQDKNLIKRAFDSFSKSTCIRFISRTKQKDYIHIKSLQGCSSYVGRQGKEQIVSLNRPGCMYHGTVQHELLHSLGFHHEHSRSDRDKHIRILLKNVKSGHQHNFLKRNTLNQGTPYDYGSVMHYGRLFFSKDNKSPTLEAVPNPKAVFGTAKQMSQNDINRVNLLYCKK